MLRAPRKRKHSFHNTLFQLTLGPNKKNNALSTSQVVRPDHAGQLDREQVACDGEGAGPEGAGPGGGGGGGTFRAIAFIRTSQLTSISLVSK